MRSLYFLWLLLQVSALYFSGWFSSLSIYKGASWQELIGYKSEFFLIQTFDLTKYDLTEFMIYYAFLPYFFYRVVVLVKDGA